MRIRTSLWVVLSVASVASAASVAHAGPHDFVIYAPGMGGTAADAKPYLDKFLAFLEQKLGWTAATTKAEYIDEPKALTAYLEKNKPGFGLVSPGFYLASSCDKKSGGVTPIASVVRGPEKTATASTGKYHVVVKSGTAKSLADLKGKRLISNHLVDPRYVSRVILDGKFDVEKDFQPIATSSGTKPFKALDRGEADAALVSEEQLEKVKDKDFGKGLEVVWTSAEMPPAPVVSFDAVAKPADRDALKKALLEMCSSKDGAETCKSMTITRFEKLDPKVYEAAQKRYCGK